MAAPTAQQVTQTLLARAHSPDSVNRIYSEKIQHRTLHLRASSPPPKIINARATRRKIREERKIASKKRPKPLSSRQRRRLGLYDIPKQGQVYDIYEPLYQLWQGYAREILGSDIYSGGTEAAAKLASAELHGAYAEVVKSNCPTRIGIKGIIVRDRKFVFEFITEKNGLKIIPKEGTIFRIEIFPEIPRDAEKPKPFAFEVLGDQFMLRSADRANRKFKQHFLRRI